MHRIWWAARERQRFFTYAGTRQHPKRPRVLVGSVKRHMQLSPCILSRVLVSKSKIDKTPWPVMHINSRMRQWRINWQR